VEHARAGRCRARQCRGELLVAKWVDRIQGFSRALLNSLRRLSGKLNELTGVRNGLKAALRKLSPHTGGRGRLPRPHMRTTTTDLARRGIARCAAPGRLVADDHPSHARMREPQADRERIPTMGNQRVTGDIDTRVSLAQDRTTAPAALYELSSDPSAQVRAAVAARPDAPAEALRPLARDRDRAVREAVAKNPATSQGNLLRLVGDADRWVRWAVAANPACDARVRQVMVKAQDKELRGLLAEMQSLEPELAAILIKDASPEVRERLASHTYDPDVIAALLQDRTVRVRKGVAINEQTSAEQRHILAEDSSPDVRAALVRAVELDEADLQALLNDRSVEVRRSMATSAVTPQHIRKALENDADETVAEDARRYRGPQVSGQAAAPRADHRRTLGKRFPGKAGR